MRIILIITFAFASYLSYCQDISNLEEPALKDIRDIFSKKNKLKDNLNDIKPTQFAFVPAVGYSLQTGFAGVLSANAAFQLGKGIEVKQSTITTSLTYSQYKQTIFPINADIWSKNGKWNYIADWRFMEYPSETWGLSGHVDPNNDGYTVNFNYLRLHTLALRSFAKNWFIGTGISYDRFWNIKESDSEGKPLSKTIITALRKQGLTGTQEIAVGFPLRILYDSRTNQLNPTNGFYLSVTARKDLQAFNLVNDNWASLVIDARKYFKVSESGNVLALWFYSWRSEATTPYFMLPSTGWDDNFNTGRGYIQGRFRSHIFNYFEAEYRFRILKNGLLGGVVFSNFSTYITKLTTGVDAYAPAAGAGLRIKLNKHSGANLCIDYGIGENGSRGFFVNIGEVF